MRTVARRQCMLYVSLGCCVCQKMVGKEVCNEDGDRAPRHLLSVIKLMIAGVKRSHLWRRCAYLTSMRVPLFEQML
jgi:hypothetical protein